jgi:hypothetical protein
VGQIVARDHVEGGEPTAESPLNGRGKPSQSPKSTISSDPPGATTSSAWASASRQGGIIDKDGGMNGQKSLGGSGRFEALHLALASTNRKARILRPIVLAQTLLMASG